MQKMKVGEQMTDVSLYNITFVMILSSYFVPLLFSPTLPIVRSFATTLYKHVYEIVNVDQRNCW